MSSQKIYPHGAPVELAPNLWQVRGSLPMPVPRNMTVHRTAQGELVLYSVIAMREEGMRALEALGRPAVMVIPHRRHQMDAPFYKSRYPGLRVLAPDPSRVRGVAVDGGLGALSDYGVDARVLPGNTYEDVAMEVPLPDGRALVVCETLGNVRPTGLFGVLFRVLGPPGGGFGVARAVRWREVRDATALRVWLSERADHGDVRMLLFGHGDAIVDDAPGALRTAAAQLA